MLEDDINPDYNNGIKLFDSKIAKSILRNCSFDHIK